MIVYPNNPFNYPYQPPQPINDWWKIYPYVQPNTVPAIEPSQFDWSKLKLSATWAQSQDKKVWDRYPNTWVVNRSKPKEKMPSYPSTKLYILMPVVSHQELEITQEEQELYVRVINTWDVDAVEGSRTDPFKDRRANTNLAKMMSILDKNGFSNKEYVFDLDRKYEVIDTNFSYGVLEINLSERDRDEAFKKKFSIGHNRS